MNAPEHKIKILHLEDLESDAELIERELKKVFVNFEKCVVSTRASFIKALDEFDPDIILSDHSLPSFDSVEALKLVKEKGLHVPFILITSSMTDEFAASVMREGTSDYIIKDRLQRLPSAVLNSLEKFRLEKEKQQYLDQIAQNEKRYRTLIEKSKDMIILSSADGKVMYASPSTDSLFGYSLEEIPIALNSDFIHPEDYDAYLNKREKILAKPGESFNYQLRLLHKNGSWIWCEITLTNMLNEAGVNAMVANFRDISERKNAELEKEKLLTELIYRSKSLEQFAYIVSHNLRSPIANILGISNILKSEMSEPDRNRSIAYLFEAITRLDGIIKDLNSILELRSELAGQKQVIFLSEIISSIETSIQSLLKENAVQLITDFSAIDKITSVKGYIHSIFLNLVSNSIKYKQRHPPVIIRIKSELIGHKIRISFKDNGIGIDLNKYEDKLFGLYKRFHPEIEGKGLGLFMVKTQVETLGGSIRVESELNKGTEFIIELPL